MIKVIAFDLVGVLITEKDINLTVEEEKLERMFGLHLRDEDYLLAAREFMDESMIVETTYKLIDKLYARKNEGVITKIKERYPDIKLVIASNHNTYIRKFLEDKLPINYLDMIFISAEMHKIKPNPDFYLAILEACQIKADELLFLDDNEENILTAQNLGISTIKVDKTTDLEKEIIVYLDEGGFHER